MPGLDPGIHAFLFDCQNVDGRDKPGHDDAEKDAATIPREIDYCIGCFLRGARLVFGPA